MAVRRTKAKTKTKAEPIPESLDASVEAYIGDLRAFVDVAERLRASLPAHPSESLRENRTFLHSVVDRIFEGRIPKNRGGRPPKDPDRPIEFACEFVKAWSDLQDDATLSDEKRLYRAAEAAAATLEKKAMDEAEKADPDGDHDNVVKARDILRTWERQQKRTREDLERGRLAAVSTAKLSR